METLILDATGICHRVKHAYLDLSTGNNPTGVIFGFLRQLLKYSKVHNTHRFVFTWDSQKSFRREIFPAYKFARKAIVKSEEDNKYDLMCYKQFDTIRDVILPNLGFTNNFRIDGYEADDLIASIVINNEEAGNKIIISEDRDLLQVLGNEVSIFFPGSDKLYTMADFKKDYKHCHPHIYAKILEIAGCSSDDIPPVAKGIGKKSALKYLLDEIPTTYTTYRKIISPEAKAARILNRILTLLPFPGYKEFPSCPDIKLNQQPWLKTDDFIGVFEKYEMRSFLRGGEFHTWVERFKLID